MSEHAAAIAQIEGLIAELSEQMREPASPRLHQEQDRGLDYAEQLLIALRADDAEDLSRVEDERLKAPRGLREYAAVERYVQVRHDVEPWEVWVRWDAVPPELREDVASLASLWRDIVLNRPPGRPKRTK
jgi:hypothetical protein